MTPVQHISEEAKKNFSQVWDKDFIIKLLNEKLGQYYADFKSVAELEVIPYKKHLGMTSAVFVANYKIKYLSQNKNIKKLEIFVSAHSDGSRQQAYRKNKFLFDHGFNQGNLRVTRPLFYLAENKAYFYQAASGHRLFSFFRKNPGADLRPVFSLLAAWIKKLHSFRYQGADFSWPTFTIAKMIPEPARFINDFGRHDQPLGALAQRLYDKLAKVERNYQSVVALQLVYGDNHPENVIIESLETDHLEMIDLTDIALGDPMLDLGTFLQQFDFMGHNYISREKMNQAKIFFVESYFGQNLEQIDINYINRINLYQSWTSLRTATFLFYMKDVQNPIIDLLDDGEKYLALALDSNRKINLFK
ncbi:MAG: hypothetical protein C3F02_01950 [Parcubacteria group bacterium]|nr:MAG: hypothetical protein C3F02_01950 [Parcubacteria group bacterium]